MVEFGGRQSVFRQPTENESRDFVNISSPNFDNNKALFRELGEYFKKRNKKTLRESKNVKIEVIGCFPCGKQGIKEGLINENSTPEEIYNQTLTLKFSGFQPQFRSFEDRIVGKIRAITDLHIDFCCPCNKFGHGNSISFERMEISPETAALFNDL